MAGWKITSFDRRYIDTSSNGRVSSVMFVFGGVIFGMLEIGALSFFPCFVVWGRLRFQQLVFGGVHV